MSKVLLSLVLRFADVTCSVREEFISFMLCNLSTTGVAVANTITSVLQKLGLDLRYLRGQGYDGSGNMAGKCKGAAAIIQRDCPKAIYVHCAS